MSTVFRLGEINTTIGINADVDDLKVFDVALTAEQVNELYEGEKPLTAVGPSLETKSTKAMVTRGKNVKSANASIVTSGDVNGVTKNIEVYSQGQKIVGSNAMNINDLPEGTYLLKITSAPAKKVTSK